jgi:V8-like Glu-specific endopeptidase
MAKSRNKNDAQPPPTSSPAAAGGTAENAALDNALYPPRLDLMALPESVLRGAGPDYSDMLESICGVVDDSQAVEQYDGTLGVTRAFVDAHENQAVQVQWNDNLGSVFTNPGNVSGVRWGSATLIGPDLLLTCGHLFDSDPDGWVVPRRNGTANAISPQEIAAHMHINVGFQVDPSGTLRAEQRFPITQLVEYRLGGLDMAVCRVGGSPGTIHGWSEVSTTNASVGDMLAIIGHPAGQPKRIEAGPATQISGGTIRYDDIDTLGGNSGSGILHSPSGRIVGVHTNGGCNTSGTGSNSGVAIAAFVAASPTLQALTPGSRTARGDDLLHTDLSADVVQTILSTDTGLRDRLGTPLSADILGTVRAADTGLRDQIGTRLTGDVPVQRPFVQAGAFIPVAEEQLEPTLGTTLLAELEGAINAQAAALAALEQVYRTLAVDAGEDAAYS